MSFKAEGLRVGDVINGYCTFRGVVSDDLFLVIYKGEELRGEFHFHSSHLQSVHRDGKQIYPEVQDA